jgi:D-glycero-D-manno-heptose 1,7-bisphosphate phosphatase
MFKILFLDLDETIREPKVGQLIQPWDNQQPMPGAKEAIAHFKKLGWNIFGVSNQDGVAAGKKSIDDCIKEQQYTLSLFPEISTIYFSPDFKGKTLGVSNLINTTIIEEDDFDSPWHSFRKPGSGMVHYAISQFCDVAEIPFDDIEDIWMIGDREEDEGCAKAANINFCPAEAWRNSFLPGVQIFHGLDIEQIRFLET